MPDISNYMDLILNPALKNLQQPASTQNISEEALAQAEEFNEIFSQMTDMAADLIDDGTVKPIESSEKEEDTKSFQSYSQQFGPPLGLDIENFDYSMM